MARGYSIWRAPCRCPSWTLIFERWELSSKRIKRAPAVEANKNRIRTPCEGGKAMRGRVASRTKKVERQWVLASFRFK